MTDIQIRLAAVAAEVLQTPVQPWQDVVRADTPAWDSLSHIRLLLAVEEEFGVRFSAEEFGAVRTLGEIAALLGRKP